MSPLRQALDDYLEMRRGLGFKLQRASKLLPDFLGWVERQGARTITCELAITWALSRPVSNAAWSVTRLGEVRGFARYLHALDNRTEVPAPDLLFGRYRRGTPYLYSRRDMTSLFSAARELCCPFRAATISTLLGLLATTGLRPGEAIRLHRVDVDMGAGVLVVRETKFDKSREVPLHPSTVAALRRYSRERDRLFAKPPSFFLSMAGTPLAHTNLSLAFRRLLRATGIGAGARRRPRLHDFRHTFAITTLLAWYRDGEDVDSKLPQLSTYLGHVDPAATYWYLSASPELMALTARRLERAASVTR